MYNSQMGEHQNLKQMHIDLALELVTIHRA
jgi:hypothetical protein